MFRYNFLRLRIKLFYTFKNVRSSSDAPMHISEQCYILSHTIVNYFTACILYTVFHVTEGGV